MGGRSYYSEYLKAHEKIAALEAEVERLREELQLFKKERNQLLGMTTKYFDEHPEDYDGPCLCKECCSLAL